MTETTKPRDTGLNVAVRDGVLVIEIGVDTLAFAWEHHADSHDEQGERRADWPTVVDAEEFARDVKAELLDTGYGRDGDSALTRLLDKAMRDACEGGSLGLSDETTPAPHPRATTT